MTYAETIDYLCGISLFGQKLGLETMQKLTELMGAPQRDLRFIHIAGTNGKGSVAAMLRGIYSAAGYRVGLYTSPHLVSFCERFQINDTLISESEVVRLVDEIRPWLERVAQEPGCRTPTFFEVVTAMALQYFQEKCVDVVIWETGLGGRLDATNIVTPLVSVITNISFDHMQYLGETLAEIAAEKAGIVKCGVPVVTAVSKPEALTVIRGTATRLGAPLTIVGEAVRTIEVQDLPTGVKLRLAGTRREYGQLEVPLAGRFQATNAAATVAAVEAAGLPVDVEEVRQGLAATHWPGRFQVVPGKPMIVLDGAHNADAAGQLAESVQTRFSDKSVCVILGVLKDKNWAAVCRELAPLATQMFCVPVNNERTGEPSALAAVCRETNRQAEVCVSQSVGEAYALAVAGSAEVIVITGSLFLVGEALARLGLNVNHPVGWDRELTLQ